MSLWYATVIYLFIFSFYRRREGSENVGYLPKVTQLAETLEFQIELRFESGFHRFQDLLIFTPEWDLPVEHPEVRGRREEYFWFLSASCVPEI